MSYEEIAKKQREYDRWLISECLRDKPDPKALDNFEYKLYRGLMDIYVESIAKEIVINRQFVESGKCWVPRFQLKRYYPDNFSEELFYSTVEHIAYHKDSFDNFEGYAVFLNVYHYKISRLSPHPKLIHLESEEDRRKILGNRLGRQSYQGLSGCDLEELKFIRDFIVEKNKEQA
jgi:hypothetical protein